MTLDEPVALDETLYERANNALDALSTSLEDFGIADAAGTPTPAILILMPQLEAIRRFISMHRSAAQKMAVQQAMEG